MQIRVHPQPVPPVPAELKDALERSPAAQREFDRWPPSHRKEAAEYVLEAKRPETRVRRAQKCVEMIIAQAERRRDKTDG